MHTVHFTTASIATTPPTPTQRSLKQFYELATAPFQRISLAQLLEFGSAENLSEKTLIRSAQWLWTEMPTRLARQGFCFRSPLANRTMLALITKLAVVTLDRLPHGLCLMPSIRSLREHYVRSFDEITGCVKPLTWQDCLEFTKAADRIVERHGKLFSFVAKGMFELQQEISRYRAPSDLDILVQSSDLNQQLDSFYNTRIGVRMLLGQHVALVRDFANGAVQRDIVGLIHRRCSPTDIARDAIDTATAVCRDATGTAPDVKLKSVSDNLAFPYVPSHLHYMLCEILKNAMRATVDTAQAKKASDLPPIVVIVAHSDENEDVAIKIGDQGGGIRRSDVPKIWSYLYSTAQLDARTFIQDIDGSTGAGPLAGLGYGLPISRLHARYFGGELNVASMEGYGTDAFLYLRRLGDSVAPF